MQQSSYQDNCRRTFDGKLGSLHVDTYTGNHACWPATSTCRQSRQRGNVARHWLPSCSEILRKGRSRGAHCANLACNCTPHLRKIAKVSFVPQSKGAHNCRNLLQISKQVKSWTILCRYPLSNAPYKVVSMNQAIFLFLGWVSSWYTSYCCAMQSWPSGVGRRWGRTDL